MSLIFIVSSQLFHFLRCMCTYLLLSACLCPWKRLFTISSNCLAMDKFLANNLRSSIKNKWFRIVSLLDVVPIVYPSHFWIMNDSGFTLEVKRIRLSKSPWRIPFKYFISSASICSLSVFKNTFLSHARLSCLTVSIIKAVISCSTHKTDQQEKDGKIPKYDNPYHKIKLQIQEIQVLGKSTGQINNTSYEWYIGS